MNISIIETLLFVLVGFMSLFLGGYKAAARKGRHKWLWGIFCGLFPLLLVCLEVSQPVGIPLGNEEISSKLHLFEYIALLLVCFFVGMIFMLLFSFCAFL